MTDHLVEFLRARVDEDDSAALGGKGDTPGRWEEKSDPATDIVLYDKSGKLTIGQHRHIARHDPARVLREVEAKRRIIERERWHPHGGLECGGHPGSYLPHGDYGPGYCGRMDEENPTLRDLAIIYADHPDYREEWRP
jgi:hypothetical protein